MKRPFTEENYRKITEGGKKLQGRHQREEGNKIRHGKAKTAAPAPKLSGKFFLDSAAFYLSIKHENYTNNRLTNAIPVRMAEGIFQVEHNSPQTMNITQGVTINVDGLITILGLQ